MPPEQHRTCPIVDSADGLPVFVIEIPVESAPRVFAACANESEANRLTDWIESQDSLVSLVAFALDLEDAAA